MLASIYTKNPVRSVSWCPVRSDVRDCAVDFGSLSFRFRLFPVVSLLKTRFQLLSRAVGRFLPLIDRC